MIRRKKLLLTFLPFLINISFLYPVYSEDNLVGYGGVYTSGKNNKSDFPNYSRNQRKIVSGFRSTLEKINEQGLLPFKIAFETDAEASKSDLNDNIYSLALVITRDDINNETFESPDSNTKINKTYINVGMVAILYQTVDDINDKNKKRNSIIFSLPVVGYSVNVAGKDGLSEQASDDIFVKVATKTLEDVLVERLKKISISNLSGKVKNVNGSNAVIDLGSGNGLIKGQNIKFTDNGNIVTRGKVESITLNQSIISVADNISSVREGLDVSTTNIKGLSDETYQVIDFKISSEKFKKVFNQEAIALQASQWFSDYLSERGGKLVLPSKIGSSWVESSNEQSYAVFIKDGKEHIFEVAKPKYSVILNLTGLSSKKIDEESNNVNENWIYKLWMSVEIPEKKFSKEFDAVSTKSIIVGTQSFEEKNEIFELLHQLTAKSAKETE